MDTMAPTNPRIQKHPALGSAAVVVAADIAGSYTPMPSGQTIFTDKKKWGSKLIQVFVHQLSDENEDQLLDTLKKNVSFVIQINISI